MVYVLCVHCGSEKIHRDGFSRGGKQRYRCRGCGRRSCQNPHVGLTPQREEEVLRLLDERTSQRGIARALRMGRVSVAAIVKKRRSS